MKKVFIKPEMKSHILRTNKMILGSGSSSCDGQQCYYVYNCPEDKEGKCIAECKMDYECFLKREEW